jgi:hypothetical protein
VSPLGRREAFFEFKRDQVSIDVRSLDTTPSEPLDSDRTLNRNASRLSETIVSPFDETGNLSIGDLAAVICAVFLDDGASTPGTSLETSDRFDVVSGTETTGVRDIFLDGVPRSGETEYTAPSSAVYFSREEIEEMGEAFRTLSDCDPDLYDAIPSAESIYSGEPRGFLEYGNEGEALRELSSTLRFQELELLVQQQMLLGDISPDSSASATQPLSALTRAVRFGRVDLLRILLVEVKFDPDRRSIDGSIPLHEALRCQDLLLRKEMVQLLLDANANTNLLDNSGHTALDIAESSGDNEIALLFVRHLLRRKYEILDNCGSSATSQLSAKFPFHFTAGPTVTLCQKLLDNLESVYNELDKLPHSGFALGQDVLPKDTANADHLDPEIFSGPSHV